MDRSTKQKINRETQTLNDTIDQLGLIDIYRTFHPKTMNFAFFSHGTFSRIDHIPGHKSSLGQFKKTEIISSIFSDHNAVRLDINYRKKKLLKIQTLNDTIDQLDPIDIYRTFHPKTVNFTFFSSAHRTFSRIDHILGHKSSLGKFKKIEIIPSIFSDHNAVRLDLNYRRKTIKNSNI